MTKAAANVPAPPEVFASCLKALAEVFGELAKRLAEALVTVFRPVFRALGQFAWLADMADPAGEGWEAQPRRQLTTAELRVIVAEGIAFQTPPSYFNAEGGWSLAPPN